MAEVILISPQSDVFAIGIRILSSCLKREGHAGHYERQLHTRAGDVTLKVPKLQQQTFETTIIAPLSPCPAPLSELQFAKSWHNNFDRKTPAMVYFGTQLQKQAVA